MGVEGDVCARIGGGGDVWAIIPRLYDTMIFGWMPEQEEISVLSEQE